MGKPKKYIIFDERNNQEVVAGLTDRDIMIKALKMFNIKILRQDETGEFKHKKIV